MATSARKPYEKPQVESERVFETVGAGGYLWSGQMCTFLSPMDDNGCNSDYGGVPLGGD